MNYLEEQTDREEMINYIQNDPKFWTAKEKKTQKIDRLARYFLIQGLPNDIYSLIDSNDTAKDLLDALERDIRGSEYGEQDRKAQNQGDVNDASGYKKKAKPEYVKSVEKKEDKKVDEKKRDMSKVKCYNCKKEGHFAKDYKKAKVKNYNYYKTKMLLAKKYSDEQVLLTKDQAWMESSSNSNQESSVNMVFMATMEKKVKVQIESEESDDEDISDLKKITALLAKSFIRKKYYVKLINNSLRTSSASSSANKKPELQEAKVKDYNYYKKKMLPAKKDSDEQVLLAEDQAWMESSSDSDQEINANMVFMAKIEKTVHMIMPSKDNLYNGRKGIGFENPRYFEKAKDLRPTLYDEKVIGLGYTPMFLTHSDEALEIEKFKRSRENKIEFAYDYGNLNANYLNEKINLEDDYFQEIINPDFDKIDSQFQQTSSLKPYVPNVILEKIIIDLEDEVVSSESENQSENDCLVVEKECNKKENPKVIAPGMFKLNVSHCVSPVSMSKSSCDSNNVEIKLKRKRRNRKSSKQNVTQVDNDVSHANSDFVHFLDLYTFNSVRRPKNSDVIWKKKGSSNTSNVGLFAVSVSNLNKNVKRYSRKDLLAYLMVKRFEMSMMGEMKFFLGLQVNQFSNRIFINQSRYILDILERFGIENCDTVPTLMVEQAKLKLDLVRKPVDHTDYRSMIGSLMYVTSSLPKMKFKKDHLCSACEQRKNHRKHHKSKTAFALNKPLYLLHMDLYGPMRVESINKKRYVLVVVDDYSRYTWVFFLHSKDEAFEVIISFIKKTQVNLQLQVQRVRTDNGTEFKNKNLAKFFDEVDIQIMCLLSTKLCMV
nr:retrovirus-related Pol polyprotein from transposon TNT 1-94 [Tanacetum cinerariifolium]